MRTISFWLFWVVAIGILFAVAMSQIASEKQADPMLYINTMFILSAILMCAIVDYHFTTVVNFHAKIHAKRI